MPKLLSFLQVEGPLEVEEPLEVESSVVYFDVTNTLQCLKVLNFEDPTCGARIGFICRMKQSILAFRWMRLAVEPRRWQTDLETDG
jgi:hypothetical protein